jgi:hypothetical protein
MREELLELIRLLELLVCGCATRGLVVLVPIELPKSEELLELIRLREFDDVGVLLLIVLRD